MLLIPAIDLKDGKCVRLKQGDMNDSTIYGDDPAAVGPAPQRGRIRLRRALYLRAGTR